MLSFEDPSMQEPLRVKLLSGSTLDGKLFLNMAQPLVVEGMKHLLKDLTGFAESFFSKVKKNAAEKKSPIGRVTEACSSDDSSKIDAVLRPLLSTESFKDQVIVGPVLNETFINHQHAGKILAPCFWATGPHHETTHLEPNKLGSIRVYMIGTRSLSCTCLATWIRYCRQHSRSNTAKKGNGKGKSATPAADVAVVSLGQVAAHVSYKDMKERFRNLTEAIGFKMMFGDVSLTSIYLFIRCCGFVFD